MVFIQHTFHPKYDSTNQREVTTWTAQWWWGSGEQQLTVWKFIPNDWCHIKCIKDRIHNSSHTHQSPEMTERSKWWEIVPGLRLLPQCAHVPSFRHNRPRPTASTATWEVTAEAQRETKWGQGSKTTCCRESLLIDVLWCKTMTWTYCKDLIAIVYQSVFMQRLKMLSSL